MLQAVKDAGFRPLLVNEFAPWACTTLQKNDVRLREEEIVPEPGDDKILVPGDVQELKMGYLEGTVDLIAGGPPCQPFSLGGIAKGDEDKRNMFPEMFRAIREIQPKAFICENVRGLLRPSFRPYFEYIKRELELPFEERDPSSTWDVHDALLQATDKSLVDASKRYQVQVVEVNAADYGVPQIRNRVVIVGFREDLGVDMAVFNNAVKPTHSEAALLHSIQSDEYWENHPKVLKRVRKRVKAQLPGSLPLHDGLLPWRTLRDATAGIVNGESGLPEVPWEWLDRKQYEAMPPEHIGWPDARIYPGHTPNVRDRPAKTVKAGVHGVAGGELVVLTDDVYPGTDQLRHRYMTVRETARVMTFPDTWALRGPRSEQMRQLGNAVPVLLGKVFAQAVHTTLDEVESRR